MTNLSVDVKSFIATWASDAMNIGLQSKEVGPYMDFGEVEKGLCRSAFQKTIRRGDSVRALAFGKVLYDIDPQKAFEVLAVVAGEDVGIGNLPMLSLSLLCTLKTFRNTLPDNWIIFRGITVALANAPKNRYGCEVNVLSDVQLGEDGINPFKDAAAQVLISMLLADNDDVARFRALQALRHRCKHGNAELMKQCIDTIREMVYKGYDKNWAGTDAGYVDGSAITAALLFERRTDELHLGVILAILAMLRIGPQHILTHTAVPYGDVEIMPNGLFPWSVLDQHTNIGRKALNRFVKIDVVADKLAKLMIKPADASRVMGALDFFFSGCSVAPMMELNDLDVVTLGNDQRIAYTSTKAGFNVKDIWNDLVEVYYQHTDDLNFCRNLVYKMEIKQ